MFFHNVKQNTSFIYTLNTSQNFRENCGRRNDMFSFPIPQGQDSDQPGSPADHLFFNGKLLPHYFPTPTPSNFSYSRSTSRTSSISSSSKDSMVSSRSNSTNSRSSNCSSARTSTSEAASERKLVSSSNGTDFSGRRERKKLPAVSSGHYEYCRRWQLFAAAPVLRSSRKGKIVDRKGLNKKSSKGEDGTRSWFGWKILKLFVSACQECHAIKT